MGRINLEDLDKYSNESSIEKFKKKGGNTKMKKVKKDKHRKQINIDDVDSRFLNDLEYDDV